MKTEPVGNAAKMREALKRVIDWFNDGGLGDAEEMDDVIDFAESALSAPPRNCDLYATESDALKAWDGLNEEGAGDWFAFTDWLFAEAKGEVK